MPLDVADAFSSTEAAMPRHHRPAASRLASRIALALLVPALLVPATPAAAWEMVRSSANDNKPVTVWALRGGLPLTDSIAIDLGLRVAPQASDLFGPAAASASFWDVEADVVANLELPAIDPGQTLVPVLVPYVGGRYVALPIGPITSFPSLQGLNHAAGPTYGLRLFLALPLNLVASAYVGGTTFVWGQWRATDTAGVAQSGDLDPQAATVPVYGASLRWTLADFLSLYVGLEQSWLPSGLAASGPMGGGRTTLNSLKAGLSFPFFSL